MGNTTRPDEFTDFACNAFDELKELFKQKNQQYGNGGTFNPLQNFELGAAMCNGTPMGKAAKYYNMYEEAKAYERKHIAHVMGNGANGVKVDESLKDIAVYSVIELYMIHKFREALGREQVHQNASDCNG